MILRAPCLIIHSVDSAGLDQSRGVLNSWRKIPAWEPLTCSIVWAACRILRFKRNFGGGDGLVAYSE